MCFRCFSLWVNFSILNFTDVFKLLEVVLVPLKFITRWWNCLWGSSLFKLFLWESKVFLAAPFQTAFKPVEKMQNLATNRKVVWLVCLPLPPFFGGRSSEVLQGVCSECSLTVVHIRKYLVKQIYYHSVAIRMLSVWKLGRFRSYS